MVFNMTINSTCFFTMLQQSVIAKLLYLLLYLDRIVTLGGSNPVMCILLMSDN